MFVHVIIRTQTPLASTLKHVQQMEGLCGGGGKERKTQTQRQGRGAVCQNTGNTGMNKQEDSAGNIQTLTIMASRTRSDDEVDDLQRGWS